MSKQEITAEAGFVYDLPKLIVSQPEFSFRVQEGAQKRASFTIKASDGSHVRAQIMSDSYRIVPAVSEVSGTSCEVLFGVDVKGLRAGKKVEGSILISSNLSEISVPVQIEVTELPEDGLHKEVHTLDDFSRLCMREIREGFRLFTSPGFTGILNGSNRRYLSLYKGMSRNPVTYQHLEEFLIACGKKAPIEISLDKQEKAAYHLDVSQKDTLYIYKNTWGYIRLEVEVIGDFLEVEKKVITSEDFIGKVYGLEYVVRREMLGTGRSYGKILIRSVHQTLEFTVEASASDAAMLRPSTARNRRVAWLMRDYLNLQLHILDYRGWQESSSMTVQEMLQENPSDVWATLYQAYLTCAAEDYSRTMEILWPFKDGILAFQTAEQKAVYLSIAKTVGLLPQEQTNILPRLRKYFMRHPNSYLLLHLIHKEEGTDMLTSADLMEEYEDCFRAGCSSPFLYLDAWKLLAKEEALLRRLSPFMLRVLNFGQKQGYISEGLLQRAAFLSSNEKNFSPSVFRVLTVGYRKYPNDDILEAICKLLIKGNPNRRACFEWYEKAVERDLRVTRLYEYYMETYSRPASEEIPLPVRMYFATNNMLEDRKKALLYASVILHKDADETGYLNYSRYMRDFALSSLQRGKIDENYAVLYAEYFRKPESAEMAEKLANVIFARKVTVPVKGIRKVIVSHSHIEREEEALVIEGVAYPRVYSEDSSILFEDVNRRRFAVTVPFTKQNLLDPKDFARACMDFGINHPGLTLYMCHDKAFQMEISSRNINWYRAAVRNTAFTDEYRDMIRRKLLDYDLAHPDDRMLPDALPDEEVDEYARADRIGTTHILIREGRYEDAWHVISGYGYEEIRQEQLQLLAGRLILDEKHIEEEDFTCFAWNVYENGCREDVLLVYLRDRYEGSVKNLCRLWKSLTDKRLDQTVLEKKILLQSMRTHQFPDQETEVLRSYMDHEGEPEVCAEFLAYLADHYFLGNRQTSGQIFSMMEEAMDREELDKTICKLALLKYYAQIGTLDQKQTELCRVLLKEMDERGLRFEFYGKLPKELLQAYQIEDKIFIQEQYDPECRVVIHYRLTELDGQTGAWISEPVRNVYKGIFVREFLLFYGETLTYYLSVMTNGKIENTDCYEISLSDMDTSGNTKFRLLNRMLEARDNNDSLTLQQTMDQYRSQEAFVDEFLKLMD
ncbi:MAG: DUF5717 family protein [Eubacteriales bacterium]|nr:DUF5717 family protein [Eubacteriales bacterium]